MNHTEHTPWRVEARDLPTRAGTHRDLERALPVTERWGTDLAWLEPGEHVHVEASAEAVVDGVFLTGVARASLHAVCVRCLTPLTLPIEARIDELFMSPEALERAREEGDEEVEDMVHLEEGTIDLDQPVRDAILGEVPFTLVCEEDCPGLCPGCGIDLRDAEPGHAHEQIDPRLASLAELRDRLAADAGDTQ